MKILIVGAGIAGLAAAQLLSEQGHRITLLERTPGPRDEGYMIDFFGPGYDVAERMGLLPQLEAIHYPVPHLTFSDPQGKVLCDMDYPRLRREVFRNRHFNFMRGELERVLLEQLDSGVEIRWGNRPQQIALADDSVTVEMSGGAREEYDLLIGADGVHSAVRDMLLPEQSHLLPLSAHTAAFILDRNLGLDAERFSSVVAPGKSAAVYPIRGGRTATFFVYSAANPIDDRSREGCFRALRREYTGCGSLTDLLLDNLQHAQEVFFDEVVQVQAAQWSRGRAVLLGDACGCVSLLGGQGASMALAGAYVLAQELEQALEPTEALRRYEARLRPAVLERQKGGRRNRGWFMPTSALKSYLLLRTTHFALRSPLARLMAGPLGGGSIPLDSAVDTPLDIPDR